jgi:hypothetical protein
MKKFTTYLENINNNDILVIVDVQIEFEQHIPKGFVEKLKEYSKNFKSVYHIYDTNKVPIKPLYDFRNSSNQTCENIPKRFGHRWFDKDLLNYIEQVKLQKDFGPGKLFKIGETETYVIYNDKHNHKWFFVNNELVQLIRKLVGKNVTLVGGADSECLHDIFITFERFGVKPVYNHEYIYSAMNSNKEQVYNF